MSETLLSVRGLRVRFGATVAVHDLDLDLADGATAVVLGESGSGKSVMARALIDLAGRGAHVDGAVRVGGVDVLGAEPEQLRRLRGGTVGYIPQNPSGTLDPLRRVEAQIEEVLRVHAVASDRAGARARARALLAEVRLRDVERVARAHPHELSGGMRQRVAIALAIAAQPALLLADEATTALDAQTQDEILQLLATLRERRGMALVLITHDVDVARQVGGEVIVMYAGRVVERGPAHRVLARPAHPYTAGLLAATPTSDVPRGALPVIPGRPPAVEEHQRPGCAFAPRCRHALASCTQRTPPLVEGGAAGAVACPVVGAARMVAA